MRKGCIAPRRQSGDGYRARRSIVSILPDHHCGRCQTLELDPVYTQNMFFALGSIAGAGLAALSTFKKTLMSGAEKAPINLQISMQLNSENVTIVSPQPLEVIGAQFDFKFIDTAYNLSAQVNDSRSLGPLDLTLRNKTFEGALFPSKIRFIPDSDPPTAEARILVFTHPGLAEGQYNLSINEWVIGGPFNTPSGFSHFDVPVVFSLDPKGHEDNLAHEEL